MTTGNNNTSLGMQSMLTSTGSGNTCLGGGAGFDMSTGSGNIVLGGLSWNGSFVSLSNRVFTITTQDNYISVGSTLVTNAYIQVAWTVVSDARDKMNFAPVPHGLAFVNQLNPVSFQFKKTRDEETPNGSVRYGFKAQDILKLEGRTPVIIDNDNPEKLRYNGESLVPILVKAIQELTAKVEALEARC